MASASPRSVDGPGERSSLRQAVVRVEDAYLPLTALASYAGLSVRKLREYLTHPVYPLPSYRIGGKVLVRRSEFDVWAQQFRTAPRSTVNAIVTDVLRGL